MKTTKLLFSALVILFSTNLLCAQEIDKNELARRILTKTFHVQPGNLVLITGGQHTLDLLEAFTIETQNLGATVLPVYNTDKILKSYFENFPEEHYADDLKKSLEFYKIVDVLINLPSVENEEAVYKEISEEKLAKIAKFEAEMYKIISGSKLRGGNLLYPTEGKAKGYLMDFATYKEMIWRGINADYTKISEQAKMLSDMLRSAKKIEITAPTGTKLSFSSKGREVIANDCVIDETEASSDLFMKRWVNFPGGNLATSVIENSANGKVVIPKMKCNFEKMENISFILRDGKLFDFMADKGQECFLNRGEQYKGPKELLSGLVIGLNPEIRVIEDGADYRPSIAAGMVYLVVGDNTSLGGTNQVEGMYSESFPITNATVWIDGKKVINDGVLITIDR